MLKESSGFSELRVILVFLRRSAPAPTSQIVRGWGVIIRERYVPHDGNDQKRKSSPKRKFLERTSRGHPGVIRADVPGQNFGQGPRNPGKTCISARTSMTRRRGRPRPQGTPKNFGQKNFGLNFRSLNEWKKCRAVPRAHPSRTLLYVYFNRSGSKGAFSFSRGDVGSLPLYSGTFARSYSVSKLRRLHAMNKKKVSCE